MDFNKVNYIVMICLLLFCCDRAAKQDGKNPTAQQQKDDFYTESASGDIIRFPLIKPYEVVSIDDGESWSVELPGKPERISDINNPGHVNEVCVTNGIILLHAVGETIVMGKEVKEAWYAIIPEQSTTKGFSTLTDFKAFVLEKHIGEIKWVSSQKLFNQFDTTVCLPWIKGC
jgi:hypothetical protein